MPGKRPSAAQGGTVRRGGQGKGSAPTLRSAKSKPAAADPSLPPSEGGDRTTVHVQKFRFQYVNSKPVSQLEPGTTYRDRVSLSIPCREVWQRVLQDPRFSRKVPDQAGSAVGRRTFIPLRELSTARLQELALCVWKNMSWQGRRHLGEQYWRARSQSFENYVRKLDRQGKASGGEGLAAAAEGEEGGEQGGGEARGLIPDPEPLADSHRDPYLMRGIALGSKKRGADNDNGNEGSGDGHRRTPNYNALRQSQSVSDSPAQFLNSLRCCYAEVAAPKGALVLLRGNSHNQSGKQVLAEYVQHPEQEVGSEFWRDADADEALAGYLDAAGRRVAYPWRQRLVRVICPIPKEVIARKGSNSLTKQLNSSKLMKVCDAAMLREYAEEWRKRMEENAGKGQREGGEPEPRKKRGKPTQAEPPTHKRHKVAVSLSTASSSTASSSMTSSSRASSSAAPIPTASGLSTSYANPAQPSHPSYQALYKLLEQTHFPKSGQRPNVAGYENVTYLIFGLHRRRDTHQLELTEATRLAFDRLAPGEQEPIGAGDEAEGEERAKPADAAHYRALLEAVLRHFREVGLGAGASSGKAPPPAPRSRRRPGIRDPLRGKFIPASDVFFTSVMVAKNKRTFMHRDANNKGPSYQVVVTDASCVGSGEFQGGNLLAWPNIERDEADRRVAELREFWELKRQERQDRRERMRHVNPVNARWVGEGDEVKTDPQTGELLIAQPSPQAEPGRLGSDGGGRMLEDQLIEESGGIGLRSLSDEACEAAWRAVYYGSGERNVERGEPTHDEDATVVPCVHRYVSFYGKRCFHATQPWTLCANRYCITFFGINLEGGGARHAKLRRELEEFGFRPHPVGMEEGEITLEVSA